MVQWERVRLSGMESDGAFTFQAALYKTGTITFSYREVRFFFPPFASSSFLQKSVIPLLFLVYQMPLSLDVISSAEHPVKVGLSDAFVITALSSEIPGQRSRQWLKD